MGTLTINYTRGPLFTSAHLGATLYASWNSIIAVQLAYLASLITPVQDVTLNFWINADQLEDGTPVSGGASHYDDFVVGQTSYAAVKALIAALPTNALTTALFGTLPSSDPTSGVASWGPFSPQAMMAGTLSGAYAGGIVIGGAHFHGASAFGAGWDGDILAQLTMHEISECMGRVIGNGQILTLSVYAGPHSHEYFSNASTPHYFSTDDGVTNLAAFNQQGSGDPGDMNQLGGSFDEAISGGYTTLRDYEIAILGGCAIPLSTTGLSAAGFGGGTPPTGARLRLH